MAPAGEGGVEQVLETVLNNLLREVTAQHNDQTVLNSLLSSGQSGRPVNK
jgi:hypothetical protein